ncbi:unnamed protein product [Amoebophrya sp. A25]|nr:unnamed protein product [Amoebophrya sp. A25]|eukprot:GSA25T00024435001.1
MGVTVIGCPTSTSSWNRNNTSTSCKMNGNGASTSAASTPLFFDCKLNQELRKYGEQPFSGDDIEEKLLKLVDILFFHRLHRKWFHQNQNQMLTTNSSSSCTASAELPLERTASSPQHHPPMQLPRTSTTTPCAISSSGCLATLSSCGNPRVGISSGCATTTSTSQSPSRNPCHSSPSASSSRQVLSIIEAVSTNILFTAPHCIPLARDGEGVHKSEDYTAGLAAALASQNDAGYLSWSPHEVRRIKPLQRPDPALRDPNYLRVDELPCNSWFRAMGGFLQDMRKREAMFEEKRLYPRNWFSLHVDVHGL